MNDAIEVECGASKLVVEFSQESDRIAHRISLVTVGQRQAILESVEGSAAEDWPRSPPLQNLSIETLAGGRRIAFLVGMAGGSHWSASIEPLSDSATLIFDLACRHRVAPGWLGSTYRLLSPRPETLTVTGDVRISRQDNQLCIQPQLASAASGTTRWRYAVKQADSL